MIKCNSVFVAILFIYLKSNAEGNFARTKVSFQVKREYEQISDFLLICKRILFIQGTFLRILASTVNLGSINLKRNTFVKM